MKKHLMCTVMLLAYWVGVTAQDTERPYRQYATQQQHKLHLEQNPEFAVNLSKMEEHIVQYGTTGNDRADQIAVVFHVLYKEGTAYPGLEQVNAALEALNRDFGPYVPPLTPYVSEKLVEYEGRAQNPIVSFCLPFAEGSPDLISVGVRFIETNMDEWEPGNLMKSTLEGGADPLDPTQYLNVWVCQLKGNVAGYAQMPGGLAETDGIVIDYDFLPGFTTVTDYPYNSGKTLTHLVGNYLGLYDLWNEDYPCADDWVADTPNHNAPNHISPAPGTDHIALCGEGPIWEMYMNFMDGTDDDSQNMFTAGQKNRIKAVLAQEGPRSGLATATTLCSGQGLNGNQLGLRGKSTVKGSGNSKLQLYPNPTRSGITIKLKGDAATADILIYNNFGAMMQRTSCSLNGGRQTIKLDCEDWPGGLYRVAVNFSDGTDMSTVFSIAR